jgi:hypothetical protein
VPILFLTLVCFLLYGQVALFAQPDPIQQIQNALDEIGLPANRSLERPELSTSMLNSIVQQSRPTAKKPLVQ